MRVIQEDGCSNAFDDPEVVDDGADWPEWPAPRDFEGEDENPSRESLEQAIESTRAERQEKDELERLRADLERFETVARIQDEEDGVDLAHHEGIDLDEARARAADLDKAIEHLDPFFDATETVAQLEAEGLDHDDRAIFVLHARRQWAETRRESRLEWGRQNYQDEDSFLRDHLDEIYSRDETIACAKEAASLHRKVKALEMRRRIAELENERRRERRRAGRSLRLSRPMLRARTRARAPRRVRVARVVRNSAVASAGSGEDGPSPASPRLAPDGRAVALTFSRGAS
jgi:hypothetical protein